MAEPNAPSSADVPAEQSLRQSEALYRLLAENSSDVISRHKLSGQWLYLSPAVRGLLGYEPAALVGKDPFEHIHPDDRTHAAEVLATLVLSKQPQSATFRIRRADGVYIWSETVGRVVLNPATGELLEIVSTSRDVTERVEASRKLRIREAELAQASRLSTMGQMATEIAHELNQPLYAIANFADACLTLASQQAPPSDPNLLHWLELIKQQARRAGDVLRRITQFVRKGEVNPAAVDLNELIRDVLIMLDLEFRQQRVATRVALAEPLPLVLADRLLIEQVVVNLVRNAVEALAAADAKPRELKVSTRLEMEGVVVAISDSGPGLTESQLAGVFEPYFTTKNDGTGLGLAICRSTIEAHEGKIWARNHAQGGAEFAFLLPLAPAPPAEK
jgi:PAS domain S-box-containing protein